MITAPIIEDIVAARADWDDGVKTYSVTVLFWEDGMYHIGNSPEGAKNPEEAKKAKLDILESAQTLAEIAPAWNLITGREISVPGEEVVEMFEDDFEEEEAPVDLWTTLSVNLILVGLITFWISLMVGVWIGPGWTLLGLLLVVGCGYFSYAAYKQSGEE